jgi:dTMP kinase
MRQGKLISFEGISGAGKSTLCAAIKERLSARDVKVVFKTDLRMYRPDQGLGADIKQVLTKHSPRTGVVSFEPVSAATLLILAKRAFESETRLYPALNDGKLVLADRDIDTVCVYQWLLFEKAQYELKLVDVVRVLRTINAWSVTAPTLTIYLEGDAEVCLKRAASRAEAPDPVTAHKREFTSKALRAYENTFQIAMPGRKLVRVDTVKNDINATLEAAMKEIEQCIRL